MSHSIRALCFLKVIISWQFRNNYGQSAAISLEAKHRITHAEWNRTVSMREKLAVCCYSNSSVWYRMLCLSISSKSQMWRERPSTPTLLSVPVSQEAQSEHLLILHAGAHENIITIYWPDWGVGGWVSGVQGGRQRAHKGLHGSCEVTGGSFSFFTIQAPAGVMIWKRMLPGVLCNLSSSSSSRCWVK